MDPKLTILFMLIGAVIVLSHLNERTLRRLRRQFITGYWREFVRRGQILGNSADFYVSVIRKASPARSTASASDVGRPDASFSSKAG